MLVHPALTSMAMAAAMVCTAHYVIGRNHRIQAAATVDAATDYLAAAGTCAHLAGRRSLFLPAAYTKGGDVVLTATGMENCAAPGAYPRGFDVTAYGAFGLSVSLGHVSGAELADRARLQKNASSVPVPR